MADTPIAALIEAVEAGKWPLDTQPWMTGEVWTNICGAFNGSRDAAKALREVLLPGWLHYGGWSQGVPHFFATVWHPGTEWEEFNAIGANEARTELAAILRAHQSQQETGHADPRE